MDTLTAEPDSNSLPKQKLFQLNPNLKERRLGFFFMTIFLGILIVYLFYDGWLYEWIELGYGGANQHWDFNVFGDMQWEIVGDHAEYDSTNNLHNLVYTCYWTATIAYLALITGNSWLKQGAIGTMAFPVMSLFSTINPIEASNIFTLDIFRYHSFIIQIMYDLTHICGAFMGVYIFYTACKKGEEIDIKKITPTILFTWLLFFITRLTLQKWPFWAPENRIGLISTNQINNMPFFLYGFEYILVIAILYFINFGTKAIIKRIKNPKVKTLVPFAFFIVLTVVMIFVGLIELQTIPIEYFHQY
ncbi:hypothetical protein NEF87_003053 [Candidatus Lokiarchaeum ossiferum]|uniref:Uncharacterized protein n=1 Tax=Candidatus Lokiarchaeum ossiferum TaxID=2951803 RepID=A0ABY6HTC4_9ARCH|nr:hypothetical protein NEF87_003053 [Candidatus Lokiarchaeum sp. B-35]